MHVLTILVQWSARRKDCLSADAFAQSSLSLRIHLQYYTHIIGALDWAGLICVPAKTFVDHYKLLQ